MPASVVADTLVAMFNPQLANWRTSPAANEIERHTLAWLTDKFGLPEDSIATFTSGGSEANLSAVVVALTWAFPEYGEHGLQRLPGQPEIYLTEETHHGFNKIAHMVGLGRRSLRTIATDSGLRMRAEELKKCVVEDRQNGFLPFMVIGSAGTTAAGVIDPLPEIARICKEEGLWFHADAAWGGAAVVSPSLRLHLAGIERADSITCDAHKWLSVPMGCGMLFCRHRESVAHAFRSDVTYMPAKSAALATLRARHLIPSRILLSGRAGSSGSSSSWRWRSTARHGTLRRSNARRVWAKCCASLWRLQDGTSSIPRPFLLCALPGMAWFQAYCWRLFENGRSRGCPRRNSAVLRSCGHASPALKPLSKILNGWWVR